MVVRVELRLEGMIFRLIILELKESVQFLVRGNRSG